MALRKWDHNSPIVTKTIVWQFHVFVKAPRHKPVLLPVLLHYLHLFSRKLLASQTVPFRQFEPDDHTSQGILSAISAAGAVFPA